MTTFPLLSAKALSRVSLVLIALSMFLIVLSSLYHGESDQSSDDLTLYNPVYMSLNYGALTYPIHGWEHSTIVHPPTHYYPIALLMKVGMNSYYAYPAPLVLALVLLLLAILGSPFSYKTRLGFLLVFPLLLFFPLSSIRPDVTLAVVWFTGLILLESGRLTRWNPWRLFAGSFLLTYASGLHYYASFAFLGIFVYAFWMMRERATEELVKPLGALLLGAALFGVPYLTVYVIPNYADIMTAVGLNQQGGGAVAAIAMHGEMYLQYLVNTVVDANDFTIVPIMLRLGWLIGIAIVIVLGLARLIRQQETWGVVFAALPMILFIFFFSTGKSLGYYLPEMLLYGSGIAIEVIGFWSWVFLRLLGIMRPFFLLLALSLALLAGTLMVILSDPVVLDRDHEMHLARACAREIVGEGALVAGRKSAWYIGGAGRWHDIEEDMQSNNDFTGPDWMGYLSSIDAFVETRHMSDMTYNQDGDNLLSWYTEGVLHLKGFYLSNNMGFISELSSIFLRKEPGGPITGYGCLDGDSLYRFEEDPLGAFVFFSFVLARIPENTIDHFTDLVDRAHFLSYMALPPTGEDDLIQSEIIFMLLDYKDLIKHKDLLPANIPVRDMIRGSWTRADRERLLLESRKDDVAIVF